MDNVFFPPYILITVPFEPAPGLAGIRFLGMKSGFRWRAGIFYQYPFQVHQCRWKDRLKGYKRS